MLFQLVVFVGLVVSVLVMRHKVHGFKPGRGTFTRVKKICGMPSFGGEVKLSVPCHKILQHVKNPLKYEKYFIR
jgi:hypothetical protein